MKGFIGWIEPIKFIDEDGSTPPSPVPTFRILTESGDILTAEDGTRINTEELP